MGSQSRRSRKSNRKRDDPIHKVKERQEELRMEEKRKKNRETQARSRAKKREVSFVEPVSPHPPPDPTPPSSSPTPSLHSSPRHEPTMPSSPSYTLPFSDHGTLHEGIEHAPHEATLTLSPLIPAHDGASLSILLGHLPSPPLGADIHEMPSSLVDDVFGTPPSCPTLGGPSRMKSLSKSGARSRANAIVRKYFDDLDVESQSRVLDCLLRHSSMTECTAASHICSPHSRRASAHVLNRLRKSYSALKHKSHSDGVAARRTILAAISGGDSIGTSMLSQNFHAIFMIFFFVA